MQLLHYICSETADLISSSSESPLASSLHSVLSLLLTRNKNGEIFLALFLMLQPSPTSLCPHKPPPPSCPLGPSKFKAINNKKKAKNYCKYKADEWLTELMMPLAPDQNPTLQKVSYSLVLGRGYIWSTVTETQGQMEHFNICPSSKDEM